METFNYWGVFSSDKAVIPIAVFLIEWDARQFCRWQTELVCIEYQVREISLGIQITESEQ